MRRAVGGVGLVGWMRLRLSGWDGDEDGGIGPGEERSGGLGPG
jgi:hypothetical protein